MKREQRRAFRRDSIERRKRRTHMYETEKALARIDFLLRFVWNNEDGVLLRKRVSDHRKCGWDECPRPAVNTLHDYEDDVSGGFPLCDEHSSEWVFESGKPEKWVASDPVKAWIGPDNHGWNELWFLFAPEGKYAGPHSEKPGEWPPSKEA